MCVYFVHVRVWGLHTFFGEPPVPPSGDKKGEEVRAELGRPVLSSLSWGAESDVVAEMLIDDGDLRPLSILSTDKTLGLLLSTDQTMTLPWLKC